MGIILLFLAKPLDKHGITLIISLIRPWQEVGTTIPINSVELIEVAQHDLISKTIAPFQCFFRSRLNCRNKV